MLGTFTDLQLLVVSKAFQETSGNLVGQRGPWELELGDGVDRLGSGR